MAAQVTFKTGEQPKAWPTPHPMAVMTNCYGMPLLAAQELVLDTVVLFFRSTIFKGVSLELRDTSSSTATAELLTTRDCQARGNKLGWTVWPLCAGRVLPARPCNICVSSIRSRAAAAQDAAASEDLLEICARNPVGPNIIVSTPFMCPHEV